jgi:hypothetical protein
MTAGSIVEPINVVGQIVHRQLSVLVDLLLNPFLLQTAEEGLHDGIVPQTPARTTTIRGCPSTSATSGVLVRWVFGSQHYWFGWMGVKW